MVIKSLKGLYSTYMTKHPSRNATNLRHPLGRDTTVITNMQTYGAVQANNLVHKSPTENKKNPTVP